MRKGVLILVIVAVVFVAGQVKAQDTTCTGTVFNDVNSTTQPSFCGWIEWFSDLGITAGCSSNPPLFCPNNLVTRAQMAVFVSKAMRGGNDNSVTRYNATIGGGEGNIASGAWSTVGGGLSNTASGERSTVGGGDNNTAAGGFSTVAGGAGNTASTNSSTVSGGADNDASGILATVAGGFGNTASGYSSTVGGGYDNDASGSYSTVGGGWQNTASGYLSFAAGTRAVARHLGSFVWADSFDSSNDFPSSFDHQFRIRANGGATFIVDSVADRWVRFKVINGNLIDTSIGARLTLGGVWTNGSDRDRKENIVPVEGRGVLEKLVNVPISTWNFKAEDSSVRHMGPMAQDLYGAFGLGGSDKHISTVDADGVALAAIQGLYQVVKDQQTRIKELEAALAEVLKRISALEMPSKSIAQK